MFPASPISIMGAIVRTSSWFSFRLSLIISFADCAKKKEDKLYSKAFGINISDNPTFRPKSGISLRCCKFQCSIHCIRVNFLTAVDLLQHLSPIIGLVYCAKKIGAMHVAQLQILISFPFHRSVLQLQPFVQNVFL